MIRPSFDRRLAAIRGIVWDLDNTLYRIDGIHARFFHTAMARAAIEFGVDMDLETAVAVADKSFLDHGFSGRTFIRAHGVDCEWLHHRFHEMIDETVIERSLELIDLFRTTDLKHAIITHGSRAWALRVLHRLGLSEWFGEGSVLGMEDYGYARKADSAQPFIQAMNALALEPEQLMFVEDTALNLRVAHELGMATVLIHHGRMPADCPPYIDQCFDDALMLMRRLTPDLKARRG